MAHNIYLIEAVEKIDSITSAVSDLKKTMNKCKLTQFKSQSLCMDIYTVLFMNCVSDEYDNISFDDWYSIYNQLLTNIKFQNDLMFFISVYKPSEYVGMFKPLMMIIEREFNSSKNKIAYCANAKAKLNQIQTMFNGVVNMVKSSNVDMGPVEFCDAITGTLNDMSYKIDKMQRKVIIDSESNDALKTTVRQVMTEVQEFVQFLQSSSFDEILDEGISDVISDLKNSLSYNAGIAGDKAKEITTQTGKAIKAFDQKFTIWVKRFNQYRSERKMQEMLGESYPIMREITRLSASLVIAAATPVQFKILKGLVGVVTYLASGYIVARTNANELRKFTEQLEDEIEIMEEKISIADRKGDDKAKIQLMRLKQKLTHQKDRIERKYKPIKFNDN